MYVEGWSQMTEPFYFRFGSTFHYLLEKAYGRSNQHKLPPQTWIKKLFAKYYRDWVGSEHRSERACEDMALSIELATMAFKGYKRVWVDDWAKKKARGKSPVQWLALEKFFKVKHRLPNGHTISVIGYRDGVFIDRDNRIWIIDTKCLSRFSVSDIMESLPFDMQLMLYAATARSEFGNPYGCILNIVKRPQLYRRKDESTIDYLQRVEESLEGKNADEKNFYRIPMEFTPKEIDEWVDRVLNPILLDVEAWWLGKSPHYLNSTALVNQYGKCSMFDPIVRGDFSLLKQRPFKKGTRHG